MYMLSVQTCLPSVALAKDGLLLTDPDTRLMDGPEDRGSHTSRRHQEGGVPVTPEESPPG